MWPTMGSLGLFWFVETTIQLAKDTCKLCENTHPRLAQYIDGRFNPLSHR
jgi:hypothetical protein